MRNVTLGDELGEGYVLLKGPLRGRAWSRTPPPSWPTVSASRRRSDMTESENGQHERGRPRPELPRRRAQS